jgi:hypothetical protein
MFDAVDKTSKIDFPPIDNLIKSGFHPLSSGRIAGATAFGWAGGLGRFSQAELSVGSWTLFGEIKDYYEVVERFFFGTDFSEVLDYGKNNEFKLAGSEVEKVVYQYVDPYIFQRIFDEIMENDNFTFHFDQKLSQLNTDGLDKWNLKFLNGLGVESNFCTNTVILAAGGLGNAEILKNSSSEVSSKFRFCVRDHPCGNIAQSRTRSLKLLIRTLRTFERNPKLTMSVKHPTSAIALCLNKQKSLFAQFEIRRNRKIQLPSKWDYFSRNLFVRISIASFNIFLDLIFAAHYDLFCQFSDGNDETVNQIDSLESENFSGLTVLKFNYELADNLFESAHKVVGIANEVFKLKTKKSTQFKIKPWLSGDKSHWEFNYGTHPSSTVSFRDFSLTKVNNHLINPLERLYIIGSATFPTEGSGNPTLTILAQVESVVSHLALKLVDDEGQ